MNNIQFENDLGTFTVENEEEVLIHTIDRNFISGIVLVLSKDEEVMSQIEVYLDAFCFIVFKSFDKQECFTTYSSIYKWWKEIQ